jgi:hypothetical protein
LPNGVVANFAFNFVLVHTGVEIPGSIIFANMSETEPVVISQPIPRFWSTMLGDTVAVWVIAGTKLLVPYALASVCTTDWGHFSSMLTCNCLRKRSRGRQNVTEILRLLFISVVDAARFRLLVTVDLLSRAKSAKFIKFSSYKGVPVCLSQTKFVPS